MLLLFYVLVFVATRIMGILAPQQGIKFTPLALEGKVLTIRSPGSPPGVILIHVWPNPLHCWLNSWVQTHRYQGGKCAMPYYVYKGYKEPWILTSVGFLEAISCGY